MDPSDRTHGQRLAIVAPAGAQAFVEGIHHYRGEVADKRSPRPGLRWHSTIDCRLRTVVGDQVVRPRVNHRSSNSPIVVRAPTAGATLA